MLKQIIVGEKNIPVKFHGQVKHIIFECVVCHKQFMKPESYYKKQLKKRKNACCFCSPTCRSRYLYEHRANISATVSAPKEKLSEPKKKGGFFSQFLKSLLTEN